MRDGDARASSAAGSCLRGEALTDDFLFLKKQRVIIKRKKKKWLAFRRYHYPSQRRYAPFYVYCFIVALLNVHLFQLALLALLQILLNDTHAYELPHLPLTSLVWPIGKRGRVSMET